MRKAILLSLTLFIGFLSNAQRTCGTMHHEQVMMQQDLSYGKQRQQIEQFTQQFLASSAAHSGRAIVTIPVVVHVVYHDSAQNVSMAQIQSQINSLNLDYSKTNTDTSLIPAPWKSIAANCEIQFCLAQRDPSGNATNGVVRVRTNSTSFLDDDKVKYAAQGGDNAWNSSLYLNLWVCKLGNSLLGYAQFPGGTAATDGVVINYTAFGTIGTAAAPYNKGRTATHEVGHWLNLYHIWGDDDNGNGTCTASTECSGSDLVGDTPNQCERNYGCPTYPLTDGCTTSSPGVMFMNYMDYTDDACMYFFTAGQKARMTALFASGGTRFSLTTSQGCVAPGNVAPTASFTGNPTTICAGQTVTFTNTSTGNPTSYLWTFTGGSPATSTSATPPAVTYSAAGTYTVSLQATNANGSNTSTQTNYITVLNSTALPLTEGFQNTTFPPTNWSLNNPDNSKTWARATTAGGYGASSASAYVDNYNYNAAGQRDWLYTPTLSFTGISAGKLKWDRAYALDASNPTFADSLEVLYSVNCGQTWTSLWKKGGAMLATATGITNTFTPTAAQWKSDTVDLSSLNGQASVRFAFVNINRYGNTLFLDNINIYNATTSCNKPVAAFTASPTTVTAGSTVTFTDQSTNTPTSWAWTFGGGTPATSALQVPGAITYNTPGTYTAKLRATNSCGSDSTTVTITVISSTPVAGCDTFTNLTAADTAFALYRYAGLVGYISGHNSSGDIAKAEKFANAMPASYKVTGGLFAFGWAKTTNTGKTITATVWDANGAGGAPGTVLGSKTIPISSIYTNVNGTPYSLTPVTFTTPISVGANYYLGFQMTYSNGDSVAVLTTTLANNGNHHQQGWERWDDSTWHSYDSAYTISLSNYILPIMCSQANAPVAGFKANPTTICAGGSVTFTDTSSNTPTSWSWSFPGGTPSTSSSANPTVVYNAAGTYNVTLTVSNANGNNAVTKTGYITVRANPVLATSSVPVSCFGGSDGSASVTATVATGPYTYNWSGGGTTSSITNKPTGSYTVTVTDGSGSLCTATATVSISQPLSALTAAATATGAYCGNSNGTASVTAAGGNGSFTYVWSNTQTSANLTGLAVGTYTVTVKDAKNCTATASAAVTAQTQTITLTISKTDATCGGSNGQAAVAMSGSSIGATYHWSNGAATGSISNVTAGTYTVTVTSALGCTATASTVINNIAGPTLSTSVTPVSCFGGTNGSASVTATGGTPTITYNWSNSGGTANSIAGKPAGTYAVTVTDGNSCTATASVVITQPAAAVTASASAVTAYCGNSNGSATVTAAGGNGGYTYVWSNAQTNSNLTNVAAGVYTVTVKDSKNCSATATTTVGNQTVSITISISKTDALCGSNNGTATASSSTSGLTYIWSNGGSGAAITGLSTNTYTVTGTDSHGCSATASVTITNTNGTTLSTSTTPVSCNGGSDGGAAVTATGGSGSYTYIWSNGATTAALTGKTAGTYTVTVGDGTSCQPTASVTISQPSVVTAAATPTTAYCGNANGSAMATASGGNGGFTYLWSNSQNTATATNLAAGTYGVTIHDSKNCSASANAVIGNQVVSFTLTTSKTDAACGSANGSATASSATTGLTFVWSNGGNTATISAVASGTYTVTATETHGCTATASVTVNNASGASLSTSFTPVSCFNGTNGSASVSATGGSGTYTYSWSGGGTGATISNKPAGTYTVTVSDGSGCAPTASVVITQPAAALSGSTSTIPATCGNANGSATVTAVGGNGGYTYHWSNNQNSATASNLLAASYQVTISDSKNCTATASANVANSGAASVTPTATPVSCFNGNNGQISTAVSGGTAPYHYSWSTGDTTASVSGLIPGQYTVSVTDASGCVTTASSTLNNPAAISVSATKTDATSNSANNGTASAIASGGTGSLVYNWSNSMTGANITGLAPGTYTVTVKDANNCTATANVTVGVNTAVIDINGNVMLRIVPNPADEVVTVSAKAEQVQPATIKIYNSIGQLISSRNVAASDHFEEAFDVRDLSSGVYQIHLQYGKVEKVERFLKK